MVAIDVTGVRYSVSDKVKEYIHTKIGNLQRFHPDLQRLHVTIHEAERHGYRIDVDMHLPHHRDVVAHDTEDTVYSAIDHVTDKCAAQLRKIHGKESARHHHVH